MGGGNVRERMFGFLFKGCPEEEATISSCFHACVAKGKRELKVLNRVG